ncbi:hypothetical protein D9M71_515740 [compost metagenome]
MLPTPVAAVPLAVMLQLVVVAWPPRAVTSVTSLPSFMRRSNGVFRAEISTRAAVALVRTWWLVYMGKAMVARMPMIATTIISSIKVMPRCPFMDVLPRKIGSGQQRSASGHQQARQ